MQLSAGLGVAFLRHSDAELAHIHLSCVAVHVGSQVDGLAVIDGRSVHQHVVQADVVSILGNDALQLMQRHSHVLLLHRGLSNAHPQLPLIGEERVQLQLHVTQREHIVAIVPIVAHAEGALVPVDGTEGEAGKA